VRGAVCLAVRPLLVVAVQALVPGFMDRPRKVNNQDKHYYLLGDTIYGRAIQ
jgi:hypothetical protein